MRDHLLKSLRDHRRMGRMEALRRSLAAHLSHSRPMRRLRPTTRKAISGGGRILALVGADGSGKSSLAGDLAGWLSWKLEVRTASFGIPGTPILKGAEFLIDALRGLSRRFPDGPMRKTLEAAAGNLSARRWVRIARRRWNLFRECRRLADRGCLVLTDRYPLPFFRDMPKPMDGPRVRKERSRDHDDLAAKEEGYYDRISPPDRVLIIKTSLGELKKRKDDLAPGELEDKVRAIEGITASPGTVLIDGNRDYPSVLQEAKRRIWEVL